MENKLELLGWREWASLPDLGIRRIKCKVDTGARTSALHAFYIEPDTHANIVQFGIHPIQNRNDIEVVCQAAIIDFREVSDSGGHREKRYVIESDIVVGNNKWKIEMNLTDRDTMRFRMLIGRTAINHRFTVDPARAYLVGKPKRNLSQEIIRRKECE